MDFTRSEHSNQSAASAPRASGPAPRPHKKDSSSSRFLRYASFALLLSICVVLIGLTALIANSTNGNSQAKYVNKDQLQAVFLNGGQVYFGKISELNSKFLVMNNIYYLRVNQAVQPDAKSTTSNNDVSLVKLGCELHGPQDQMVINQEQIIFWENLKTDGQVAKAVATFQKNNPNGQNCSTTTDKQ